MEVKENEKNEANRLLCNLGKLSAIIDIYTGVLLSYQSEDDEKHPLIVVDKIRTELERTEALMKELVKDYNNSVGEKR